MKFKAVIFDLDGTLLDTIDDLANSMNAVLERAGYPIHTAEIYKYFVGNGMRNLVKRALPDSKRDDKTIDHVLAEMKQEYGKRWDEKTCPYNGIPELLDKLSEKGLKLAVLSNKADEFTKLVVAKFLPQWHFEAVIGEGNGVPKKPDPAGAKMITKQLDIKPEEILYLGDTNVDMITATSAGMYAVGVLWGFRKADELIEGGARLLIPIPAALLDIL